MSKLSFRARALDANKSLPVYHAEDVPDLPDIASVNRVVPQMPTGMEKEEETEHHLQRAITAQQIYGEAQRLIIPTPDTILFESDYKQLKKKQVVMPKQLIHVQAFTLEDELPDYDCDEDDNRWLLLYNKKNPKDTISVLEFESIIDTLEKGCSSRLEADALHLFTLKDAYALVKGEEKVTESCFEYWKQKRTLAAATLAPPVRTEKKDGSALHDPYVAFRRRVEKMQTRKNRKNDEASYEKMLALRRDLKRACLILEMVKLREEQKRNLLDTTIKVLETRYSNKDFQGELLHQCYDLLKQRPKHSSANSIKTNINILNNKKHSHNLNTSSKHERSRDHLDDRVRRLDHIDERRRYGNKMPKPRSSSSEFVQVEVDTKENIPLSKAVHVTKESTTTTTTQPCVSSRTATDVDSTLSDGPDGKFTFRRKKGVVYHAPRYDSMGNWPWTHPVEGGSADPRYCYCCTSIQKRCHCIGFARRRIGRGGRIMFDRAYTPYDDCLNSPSKTRGNDPGTVNGITTSFPERVPPWPHFKPNIESNCEEDEARTNLRDFDSWTHQKDCTASIDSIPNCKTPLLNRTFSSQPTSKFRIHPYPSRTSHTRNSTINNQVFIASLAASLSKNTDSQHWLLKKSRNYHNPINGTIFTSPTKHNFSSSQHVAVSPSRPSSTAPSSNVYQLNFPIIISTKSNSLSPNDSKCDIKIRRNDHDRGNNNNNNNNITNNSGNNNNSHHHLNNNNNINFNDDSSNSNDSNGSNNSNNCNDNNTSNTTTSNHTSGSNDGSDDHTLNNHTNNTDTNHINNNCSINNNNNSTSINSNKNNYHHNNSKENSSSNCNSSSSPYLQNHTPNKNLNSIERPRNHVITTCADIVRCQNSHNNTQVHGIVSQPILRQPINIVKQNAYVTQKLLAQQQTGGGVQISTLQVQPVNSTRTNKLSISKGLTISHTPVVTNGMTSSAGIQLAR